MLIIGITGTIGAGKGTVVDYLVNQKGFQHYSVRNYLLEEIDRQKLPRTRDSMVVIANKLRSENTPSYIIDQLYKRAKSSGQNAVIESIRTPGEIRSLREKDNFYLFAVDAPQRLRFERVKKRESETDLIDFDKFIEDENREMTTLDPNRQNLKKCIEMADFILENEGTIQDLNHKVDQIVKTIEKN